jgi:hypothetical protein
MGKNTQLGLAGTQIGGYDAVFKIIHLKAGILQLNPRPASARGTARLH